MMDVMQYRRGYDRREMALSKSLYNHTIVVSVVMMHSLAQPFRIVLVVGALRVADEKLRFTTPPIRNLTQQLSELHLIILMCKISFPLMKKASSKAILHQVFVQLIFRF
jgi:hypothetical protein